MPRLRFVFLSLLISLAATNTADAVDKAKLRQLVQLPHTSIVVGYGVNRHGQFGIPGNCVTPQPEKIAEIEKQLKGDVTDAERYRRLADLYFRAGQPDKGKEARRKTVAILRRQLRRHPDDPLWMLRLADVLQDQEDIEDAEALARRVVEKSPKDYHAWILLGETLDGKCLPALGDALGRLPSTADTVQAIRAAQPTPKQRAGARRCHQEALSCFDRAVALAPQAAEVYRRRGASRYHFGFIEHGLRLSEGEKIEPFEAFLGKEALPDLRKAVSLDNQEYLGLGAVIMLETMGELYDRARSNPSAKPSEKAVDSLSESARKRLRQDLAMLEQGMRNPNRRKAAEAAEVLGIFQLTYLAEKAAGEKSVRLSLQLDPSRHQPWEMLSALLVIDGKYQQLAELCRQRLKQNDLPWDRVLLASVYDRLEQRDKAEEVVRGGLEHAPDNFLLRLALADLLLMRDDAESVKQAGDILLKLYEGSKYCKIEKQCWANLMLACAVYLGLNDDRDRARNWLEHLRKYQPDCKDVQEALKALDEEAIPSKTSAPCPPR